MRAAYSTNSNSINESGVPQCMIWVASLSSGHVCEYRASDLIFADGSSLDSLPRAAPAGPFALEDFHSEPPAATGLPRLRPTALIGSRRLRPSRPCDVPRLHPGSRPPRQLHTATPKPTSKKTQTIAVGSKVELTTDYANYLDASSGPLKPGT